MKDINLKDLLFIYVLFFVAIMVNVLSGIAYIKWFASFPNYFQFTLGLISVAFLAVQLILIGNFVHKAFKNYFGWS